MSENELEKLFALKALKNNSGILDNVHTFSKLMEVFNNLKPTVNSFEPINLLVIAKGIKTLGPQEHEWHPEIKKYINYRLYKDKKNGNKFYTFTETGFNL